MTDVLYDKLVYGRELTREQWRKIKYRPFSDSDMYAIIEDPSFGIDKSEIGPVIPTDRILYRALARPKSTWIDEKCSENVFDENTGEGYLVLNEDVTELTEYYDEETEIDYTIFNDINYNEVEGDTNILSVIIPTQITNIGDYTFASYYNLESVTISDSVISIGEEIFSNCSNLASIAVNNGNSIYDSRNNCNAIIETSTNTLIAGCKNTIIPDSVTSIGDSAFCGCTGLISVTLHDSITTIGKGAFQNCTSLTSITIPNSVTNIGLEAFNTCSSLTEVTCQATNPPNLGSYNFTAENDTLYVPAESVQAYLDNANWNNAFSGNIQAIWSTEVTEVADMAIVGEMSIETWGTPYAYPNYIDKTIIYYDTIPTTKEFKIVYCPNNTIDWSCNYGVESNSEPLNNTKINLYKGSGEQNIIIDSSLGENANVYIDTITGKIWAKTYSE